MDLGPHSLWDEYEFPDGLGFFRHLQEWRGSGEFDGLEFHRSDG